MAARRDVKELTSTLETLAVGDRVRAWLRAPRYGDFTVEATVVKGPERGQLMAASWLISAQGKPGKALQELVITASAAKNEFPVVPPAPVIPIDDELAA